MHPQTVLLAFLGTCAAVPLNINLGAYSPALVVGDGEISLGSTESASQLMATLASGAAQNNNQNNKQEGQTKPSASPSASPSPTPQAEGEKKTVVQPTEGDAAKRAPNLRRALSTLFGKRDAAPVSAAAAAAAPALDARQVQIEAAMRQIKRDLQGFEAALGYAREAQKDQPKIELGSPNAGVGIIVNPGLNVPKGSAAAGEPTRKEGKRDVAEMVKRGVAEAVKSRGEVVQEGDAPKMTLVAITEV